MIVLNLEPYLYSEKAVSLWERNNFKYSEGNWKTFKLKEISKKAEILIVRLSKKIDKETLNNFKSLKYIISATTGLDHIDLDQTSALGIKVVSLKNQSRFLETIPSTAEHTWALLCALIRNIPDASNDVKLGNWNRDNFRGYQLKNKSIGLIGLGRVGNQVAKFAEAFDMKVSYFDPHVKSKKEYLRYFKIEDLLSNNDIISIHIHLNKENFNFLNKSNLVKLKKGVFLINTSRGKVWDENVLADLYEKGIIKGIASDVLASEMDKKIISPLLKLHQKSKKNIIITPHIAGATYDAMWECENYIVNFFLKNK